ncbi:MAG: hypothetical protein HY788_12030 [Deltaproteobacteria bacterium]|nr:hypothetical protein [Deltaproteobacteria bacterium]
MELWVNGRQVDTGPLQTTADLRSVLDMVATRFTPAGQTVTEIVLDGRPLTWEEDRTLAETKVGGLNKIEIRTHNPVELAFDGIKEGLSYLENLIIGLRTIAHLYRENELEEGSRLLNLALEGIQWFSSMIENVETFVPVDFGAERFGEGTISEHYKDLQPLLETLAGLQENRRWGEMAALLENDFVPYFERWRELMERILQISGQRTVSHEG